MRFLRHIREYFHERWPAFALTAIVMLVLLPLMGCVTRTVTTSTGPNATAPTDPYVRALSALDAVASALIDTRTAVDALHNTRIVSSDGTATAVIDDATYARINIGLAFAAAEGTTLSNLLAQRASAATISAEMAKMTAGLAAQLSPAAVGITNPDSQAKYLVTVTAINVGITALAAYIAQLPTTTSQETPHDRSRDPRNSAVGDGARAIVAWSAGRSAEGLTPIAAGRSFRIARQGQRQVCAGLGALTPHARGSLAPRPMVG